MADATQPHARPAPPALDVERLRVPGELPPTRPGAAAVLLAPPDARVDEDALHQAQAVLSSEPATGAVVELASGASALPPGALLRELITRPEGVRCVLVPTEVWLSLRIPPLDGPLARAEVALAVARTYDLACAGRPISQGGGSQGGGSADPTPEILGRFLAAGIRAFAAEDVYAVLRADAAPMTLAGALLDWTSRLLERQAYPEAFALGEYAASLGERRNPGVGPRLAPPDPPTPSSADPLVSIILPTYDRPDLLERALESLAQQTYQDLELIVVNDGGCDPGSAVARYRDRIGGGGRTTLVHHDRNRGMGAARNTGIRLARGRYVGFLDDDDRLLPHHLDALLPLLWRGARVAHGDVRLVSEARRVPGSLPVTLSTSPVYQFTYERRNFALDNCVPIHSVLLERDLFCEVGGFDERLGVLEDWDLWLRVFDRAHPARLRRITAEVRTREDGSRITEQRGRLWLDVMAQIYGKTLDREQRDPELRARRVDYLLRVCRDRKLPFPREARVWLAGAPGLAPIDPRECQAHLDAAGRS